MNLARPSFATACRRIATSLALAALPLSALADASPADAATPDASRVKLLVGALLTGTVTSDGLNATPALVAGGEYQLLPHLALGLRYVYERYERTSGADLEASHFGAGITASY